jgi:type II secretory pathway pseudopilin PulG
VPAWRELPAGNRIRPVFRDQDELAVGADLTAALIDALDRSAFLILIASSSSAASTYVDAEVRHMIDDGRADDIRIVALESNTDGTIPLPPALVRNEPQRREPLWLDARGRSRPRRTDVVSLVAGILGVSFDALWRRDRRRRRHRFAAALAMVVLLAGTVAAVLTRERDAAQASQPERQLAAFRTYLRAAILADARAYEPGFPESKVEFEILRTDDFNNDSLLDFFVINRTEGFCGSAGCDTDAYLTEAVGRYRVVANLFSVSAPSTRTASGSYREILATYYSVDAEPVYTILHWRGNKYDLDHYEYCGVVHLEYCSQPALVTPSSAGQYPDIPVDTTIRFYNEPDTSAPAPRITQSGNSGSGSVVGTLNNGAWLLVDIWKGQSGFVRRKGIER